MSRSRIVSTGGPNVLALLVACTAITLAASNFDPINTGGSPGALNAASLTPASLSLPPSPPMPQSASENGQSTAPAESKHLSGIWAMRLSTEMLRRGCLAFRQHPDYSAVMTKQERIGGSLGDSQTIELKVRHDAFSAYMKWLTGDAGRQLIYVEGQNDGHLLVQPGGIKGRLTGVLSLEPTGALAMAECRYPVTKVGLVALAETVLENQLGDVKRGTGFRCELRDDQAFNGRPCFLFIVEYDSEKVNSVYRKSVLYIDKELSLPICVRNYTWGVDVDPERMDDETLVELYAYTDIQTRRGFSDIDFDPENPEYKLRVKKSRK
ncbi:MAG: DUF1571 domain-containing protein [Planctomycetaceae bacterium]|nr:DUF1571 domain-containing protein [Planctomycetaceae bacterium]